MQPVYWIITFWLVVISILDIKFRSVPVWLLAAGGVAVLSALRCNGISGCLAALKGALPGLLLLAVAFFTHRAGYGDGIVLLVLGVASKGKGGILLGVSLFLISIFSIVLLVFHKAGRNTRIPYLPFLAAAWILAMTDSPPACAGFLAGQII